MLKILIADDHVLVREGTISILNGLDPEVEILEASDFSETAEHISRNDDIDLVLLDVRMPGMAGLTGLEKIKEMAPTILVVILSSYDEPEIIEDSIKKGADGFIPKTYSKDVFIHAVQLVLAGEIYLPSRMLKNRPFRFGEVHAGSSALTPRQKEILEHIIEGLTNKEIARMYDCAEGTVKSHVSAILKAFGVTSRAKAVAAFQKQSG